MAFAVTARHSGTSGATAVQSQATNSATPTANSMLLAFVGVERDLHTAVESWTLTGGGTWSSVAAAPSSPWAGTTDFNVTAVLQRLDVGALPSAHTITADAWAGVEDGYYGIVAGDITGHDSANPFIQSKTGGATEGGGDAESLAVTFDTALTAGSLVVACFAAGNDVDGAFTAPTIGGQPMSPVHNMIQHFCHAGMWYRVIDGTETDRTVTCSDLGQSVGASAAILVEIAPAPTGGSTGTIAATLPALSANVDGSAQASGSAASILPVLTAALDGQGLVVGAIDAQLGAISSALVGDARAEGTAANVLPSLVASVAGELSAEAVLNGQLPAITSSVDGESSLNGTVDASLPAIDSVISGDVVSAGDVAISLPVLSTDLTGTSETPQNSLDARLPAIEAALDGGVISPGALDAILPALTSSLSGSIPSQGSIAATLPTLTASLVGVVEIGGYVPVEDPVSSLRANLGTATVRTKADGTVRPNKAEAIPQ